MEPMGGLEPPTSPLPRECSTAELHGLFEGAHLTSRFKKNPQKSVTYRH